MTPRFSVIYYTDGALPDKLLSACYSLLQRGVLLHDAELIVVTQKELPIYKDTCHKLIVAKDLGHGWKNMFSQVLLGTRAATCDDIYLCEHDVLYPHSYFGGFPSLKGLPCAYNRSLYVMNDRGYFSFDEIILSNCFAQRFLVERHFTGLMDVEAGSQNWPPIVELQHPKMGSYRAPDPVVDIRHGTNLTGNRHAPYEDMYWDTIAYWGEHSKVAHRLGLYNLDIA